MSFRQRLLVSLKNLPNSTSMSTAATVTLDNMNPCIKKMEYAVRGPLVIRATAIEKVLQFICFVLIYFVISGNPRWREEAVQLRYQGQHRRRPRHGQQAHHLHQAGARHRDPSASTGLPGLPRGRQGQGQVRQNQLLIILVGKATQEIGSLFQSYFSISSICHISLVLMCLYI